ncbi:MAG: LacI family DNA-binding transcriptional regulator [Limnochordales bacterium]|nr:LacI family DNA-binding transcriptional regulator [Limnochordales bacterium]
MDVPVTIKDIARELGVAHSTVSRAIHDDPRISRETKQRVLEAVARLGYRPNAAARGLVSRRMQAVGLVIPGVADMFYGRIVDGVDRAAYEAGFGLSLYLTHGERRRELDALAQVSERRVDGLIVMARRIPKKVLLDLARQDIPLVLLEPQVLGLGIDSVRVDNRDGAYKAVRYLLDLGHRRIGFIAGPKGQRESQERWQGYRQALAEAGLSYQPELVQPGDYTEAGGASAVQRWLQLPPARRPTAIFASNDRSAIGAVTALQAAGVPVPQEISVMGYDDITAAAYSRPAITTMRQPIEEMGATAARLLIDRLVKRREFGYQEVLLKAELVVRESTARVSEPLEWERAEVPGA